MNFVASQMLVHNILKGMNGFKWRADKTYKTILNTKNIKLVHTKEMKEDWTKSNTKNNTNNSDESFTLNKT